MKRRMSQLAAPKRHGRQQARRRERAGSTERPSHSSAGNGIAGSAEGTLCPAFRVDTRKPRLPILRRRFRWHRRTQRTGMPAQTERTVSRATRAFATNRSSMIWDGSAGSAPLLADLYLSESPPSSGQGNQEQPSSGPGTIEGLRAPQRCGRQAELSDGRGVAGAGHRPVCFTPRVADAERTRT